MIRAWEDYIVADTMFLPRPLDLLSSGLPAQTRLKQV